MIIAAYTGTGKTTFADFVEDSVDFVCMPYKYYLPEGEVSREVAEASKADPTFEMRENWPLNYWRAVINEYNETKYVLIPVEVSVLAALRVAKIPYILCYPERDLKEEYERRYRERGNTEHFLDVFIKRWDNFMDNMEKDPTPYHIRLKKGEYLYDRLTEIEDITNNAEKKYEIVLPEELIELIGHKNNRRKL